MASARRFVIAALREWWVESDTADVMVSELATNAVLHARTDYTVTVRMSGDTVRVGVADRNSRAPAPAPLVPGATTGFGLRLVANLASHWGVASNDDGKDVYFEIPRRAAAVPH